jgi:hypothetical protein
VVSELLEAIPERKGACPPEGELRRRLLEDKKALQEIQSLYERELEKIAYRCFSSTPARDSVNPITEFQGETTLYQMKRWGTAVTVCSLLAGESEAQLRRQYFPDEAIWYQDVSSAPVDSQSEEVIRWLTDAGGFGLGRMQIDFSLEVLAADASAPFREFVPTDDHFSPDCDLDPVPLPESGALEGESGYKCEEDGDCHLLVVHQPTNRLYEMWRANVSGGTLYGGCLAVWDMLRVYGPEGRGENCTSADAAGFPIAPLLFTADEVASGEIRHAIRFILPNSRIRRGGLRSSRHPFHFGDARPGLGPALRGAVSLEGRLSPELASQPGSACRGPRSAALRDVSRRRRPGSAHRAKRPIHGGQVGGVSRAPRFGPDSGERLRDAGRRRADSLYRVLAAVLRDGGAGKLVS